MVSFLMKEHAYKYMWTITPQKKTNQTIISYHLIKASFITLTNIEPKTSIKTNILNVNERVILLTNKYSIGNYN